MRYTNNSFCLNLNNITIAIILVQGKLFVRPHGISVYKFCGSFSMSCTPARPRR
uniref:Uncharacterized protein n=1 Tax=Helianthus annuus TaxID=4232 RepID=A0A251VLR6_HELAN